MFREERNEEIEPGKAWCYSGLLIKSRVRDILWDFRVLLLLKMSLCTWPKFQNVSQDLLPAILNS